MAEVSVDYTVEGGYPGRALSVSAHHDGRVEVRRPGGRTSVRVAPDQVQAIEAALAGSGLFDRDREFPAPAGGADLRRHQIRYAGCTVVAYDTTVPPALAEAVRLLERALAEG